MIEPSSGQIFVNKAAISSVNLNSYRDLLGLSLSEESPFEGTIKENVSFGNIHISDVQIKKIFAEVGLTDFLSEQIHGLRTLLKPEGRQMSYTVSKKIILARAILKAPKLLILEDPLDQFSKEEAERIISYLTHPERPWSLVVVGANKLWETSCSEIVTLSNGKTQ